MPDNKERTVTLTETEFKNILQHMGERYHSIFGTTSRGTAKERKAWFKEYSEHIFRSFRWFKVKRSSGLIEAQCQHGTGHPISESVERMGEGWGIHGCDGCCSQSDFPETEVELDRYEAIRKAILK